MAYCDYVDLPGGGKAIVRFSGKRPPKCGWCARTSSKLCDAIVSPPEQVTHKRTCDAPICDQCTTSAGRNRDLCPMHAKQGQQGSLFKSEAK